MRAFLRPRLLILNGLFILGCALFFSSMSQARLGNKALPAQIKLGAYNLLRLGHQSTKNLPRLAEIIASADLDLLAASEIMTTEAALALLMELRSYAPDWDIVLSRASVGEGKYKEFFGYYYRKGRVSPLAKGREFCHTGKNLIVQSEGSCFPVDTYREGPDFEREPYIAHFRVGGEVLTLFNVHLYYGSTSGIHLQRRKHEVRNLRELMIQAKNLNSEGSVIALGDFNLIPPRLTARRQRVREIPADIFLRAPSLELGVSRATTVGGSSYDHFLYFTDNSMKPQPGTDLPIEERVLSPMTTYKEEVSDHFLIQMVFELSAAA